MKRKAQVLLSVVMLAALALFILASCTQSKADYFNYSEENLGFMGQLVKWMHGWIGNYGWTVVVFTLFLKIVMLPLDIWQRYSTKKMSLKTQKMQPLIQEIDRRYGANTQRANEEKQKLYKKEGFSGFASCLPMILSMVIFFVMFAGLRQYSTYSSVMNFQNLSGTYYDSYYRAVEKYDGEKFQTLTAEITALLPAGENGNKPSLADEENYIRNHYTESNVSAFIAGINTCENVKKIFTAEEIETFNNAALEAVSQYYTDNHESWLWLQNVWQPDTWASIMPAYNDSTNGFSSSVNMDSFGADGGQAHYEMIRSAVLAMGSRGESGKWNGLMILPLLSIGLSFLSIFISQKTEKKKDVPAPANDERTAQQAASNKMMMFLMPAMMAVFGFMYTGAFAIYMVANYALSILSTLILRVPVDKMVERSMNNEQKNKGGKADYMR